MAETAPTVALLEDINPAAHNVFNQAGFKVVTFEKSVTESELAAIAQNANMLGVRSGPAVPAGVIENSVNLHAIAGFCVNPKVDQGAANRAGVALFNSVHENSRSVAEQVINNTLNLLRRTAEHNQSMHAGTWTKTDESSYEMRRKIMGIIGYGNIGAQVSVLAESMGMDVVYYDPMTKFPSFGRAEKLSTMEDVLSAADVITLHVPETPKTKNMINAKTIAMMKPGSYIINAARGGIVDYEAVIEALDSGQLGGIHVDVFVDEPKKRGDKFDHPLRGHRKAILTPHVAGSTVESQRGIGVVVAEKMVRYWRTGDPYESITLPKPRFDEIDNGNQRVIYIHDDKRGAMTEAHAILSKAGCNIAAEVLRVDKNTGRGLAYFDIDEGIVTPGVVDAIRSLDVARRARLIA